MGHYAREPAEMFDQVRYRTKTTSQIRGAIERKVKVVAELVLQRDVRVRKICEDHGIDAEQLVDLMLQYQKNDRAAFLSYNPRTGKGEKEKPLAVQAGVIASIVREKQMSESERSQIRKMELILRNIQETEPYVDLKTGEVKARASLHDLTDEELEYLSF